MTLSRHRFVRRRPERLQEIRHAADYDLSVTFSLPTSQSNSVSETEKPDLQGPQMPGRSSEFPPRLRTQSGVHFFERSEKAGERILKMGRATASLTKIALAKLIRARNDRRAHRPVLVRSFDPRQVRIGIDPESESQCFCTLSEASPIAIRAAQDVPLCHSLEASRYGRQAGGR